MDQNTDLGMDNIRECEREGNVSNQAPGLMGGIGVEGVLHEFV